MSDYGVRARAAGKSATVAATVWNLAYRNVNFRCLRTAWDEGPTAYLLQIRVKSGWQNTTHLSDSAHKLFAVAADAIAELEASRVG